MHTQFKTESEGPVRSKRSYQERINLGVRNCQPPAQYSLRFRRLPRSADRSPLRLGGGEKTTEGGQKRHPAVRRRIRCVFKVSWREAARPQTETRPWTRHTGRQHCSEHSVGGGSSSSEGSRGLGGVGGCRGFGTGESKHGALEKSGLLGRETDGGS